VGQTFITGLDDVLIYRMCFLIIDKKVSVTSVYYILQCHTNTHHVDWWCFQYEEGKKRRRSSYSSVDLSEVEWEDTEDEVRLCLLIKFTYKSFL